MDDASDPTYARLPTRAKTAAPTFSKKKRKRRLFTPETPATKNDLSGGDIASALRETSPPAPSKAFLSNRPTQTESTDSVIHGETDPKAGHSSEVRPAFRNGGSIRTKRPEQKLGSQAPNGERKPRAERKARNEHIITTVRENRQKPSPASCNSNNIFYLYFVFARWPVMQPERTMTKRKIRPAPDRTVALAAVVFRSALFCPAARLASATAFGLEIDNRDRTGDPDGGPRISGYDGAGACARRDGTKWPRWSSWPCSSSTIRTGVHLPDAVQEPQPDAAGHRRHGHRLQPGERRACRAAGYLTSRRRGYYTYCVAANPPQFLAGDGRLLRRHGRSTSTRDRIIRNRLPPRRHGPPPASGRNVPLGDVRPTTSASSWSGSGFAVLTWSWLGGGVRRCGRSPTSRPARGCAAYKRYEAELFGDELRERLGSKRVLPFIF